MGHFGISAVATAAVLMAAVLISLLTAVLISLLTRRAASLFVSLPLSSGCDENLS